MIGFLDTETEQGFLGEAVCCQFLVCDNEGIDLIPASYKLGYGCITESLDLMVEALSTREDKELKIYVHNLSYDLMRIISEGLPCEVVMNGASVIYVNTEYDGFKFKFVDSLNLLPSSLDSLSKSFLPPELRKKKKENMEEFDANNPEDIEYALFDVIALKNIILSFAKLINVKPDKLKLTASSQSFSFLQKEFKELAIKTPRLNNPKGLWNATPKKLNEELRNNYYFGGRIYIRNGHNILERFDTKSFDITSSYPGQMKKYSFPIPGISPVRFKKIPKFGGRYVLELKVIEYYQDLPCVPYRQQNGTVTYPHGTFKAFLSDIEFMFIEKTYKDFKYEIIEVLFWEDKKCYKWAEPYIDKYYGMKLHGDELNKLEKNSGDAQRTVGKLFLNAPYGKAAQKYSDNKPMYFNMESKTEEQKEPKDHRNPIFSILITAGGRVQLYEMINYYGAQNVIYSDTDSVKVLNEAYNEKPPYPFINDELGGWKYEGDYNELVVSAPKVYAGKHEGKIEIKAKGLTLKNLLFLNDKKNKETGEQLLETMYNLIADNKPITARYAHKPKKLKGFANDRSSFALASTRSITRPENVTGYDFKDNVYTVKVIKE